MNSDDKCNFHSSNLLAEFCFPCMYNTMETYSALLIEGPAVPDSIRDHKLMKTDAGCQSHWCRKNVPQHGSSNRKCVFCESSVCPRHGKICATSHAQRPMWGFDHLAEAAVVMGKNIRMVTLYLILKSTESHWSSWSDVIVRIKPCSGMFRLAAVEQELITAD